MSSLQQSDAVQRWFSLLAPGYDQLVAPLFWPDTIQTSGLDRLEIDSDDRVLDIGCGTGKTSTHLHQRAAIVDGLDLSRDQLTSATDKDDLDQARFVQGDATQLPYATESFDHVVSVGSILYWTEPVTVLREVTRVTQPGGSVLVMGFHRRSLSPWNPVRNARELANASLFRRSTPDEAATHFRDAGLIDIEQTITGPAWCPDLVLETIARKPE